MSDLPLAQYRLEPQHSKQGNSAFCFLNCRLETESWPVRSHQRSWWMSQGHLQIKFHDSWPQEWGVLIPNWWEDDQNHTTGEWRTLMAKQTLLDVPAIPHFIWSWHRVTETHNLDMKHFAREEQVVKTCICLFQLTLPSTWYQSS